MTPTRGRAAAAIVSAAFYIAGCGRSGEHTGAPPYRPVQDLVADLKHSDPARRGQAALELAGEHVSALDLRQAVPALEEAMAKETVDWVKAAIRQPLSKAKSAGAAQRRRR